MGCIPDSSTVIVLICGVYGSCLWGSSVRCYTLFYDYLIEDLGVDYAAASLISSLVYVGFAIGSGLSGSMFKLFGYSKTITVLGVISCVSILSSSFSSNVVLTAVGVGLIPGFALAPLQISCMAIVTTLHKNLATFFVQMFYLGVSVGPFLLCPCFQYLIESFGYRGALQIIAGMFLNITVCGVAFRRFQAPTSNEVETKQLDRREKGMLRRFLSRVQNLLDVKLFVDPSLYAYLLASAAFCSVFFSAMSYVPLYGTKVLDLETFVATTLVSALSVGDGISKVIFSFLSGRIPIEKRMIFTTSLMVLTSTTVLLLSFSRSYVLAMVACTAVGIFGGGIPGFRCVIPHDVFSPQSYASVIGYCNAMAFGASSAAQYLFGMLISSTDNLSMVYYVGFGLGLCAATVEFFWHLYFYQTSRCRKRNTKNHQLELCRTYDIDNVKIAT